MFAIEKDVPLPEGSQNRKFPWADMEVGDSFHVPCNKAKANARKSTVRASWNLFKKKNPGVKFSIGASDENGFRVWRIA